MMSLILECPWCGVLVEIIEINCGIFRHGNDMAGNQLPPHADEAFCLANNDPAKGCGKPIRLTENTLIKCGFDT